jgi:hypothetical protein
LDTSCTSHRDRMSELAWVTEAEQVDPRSEEVPGKEEQSATEAGQVAPKSEEAVELAQEAGPAERSEGATVVAAEPADPRLEAGLDSEALASAKGLEPAPADQRPEAAMDVSAEGVDVEG